MFGSCRKLATSIRGALDIQKLTVDSQRGLILVRDRVTKVRLAQKLLQDLLRPRAQVSVDVDDDDHRCLVIAELRVVTA